MSFSHNTRGSTSFLWDFGDGTTSTEANPTHIYHAPGEFDVTLAVTHSQGQTSSTADGYIRVLDTLLEDSFESDLVFGAEWLYHQDVYWSSEAAAAGVGGAAVDLVLLGHDGSTGDTSDPTRMQTEEGFLLGGGCDTGCRNQIFSEPQAYFSWVFDLSALDIAGEGRFTMFTLRRGSPDGESLLDVDVVFERGDARIVLSYYSIYQGTSSSIPLTLAPGPKLIELEWFSADGIGSEGGYLKTLLTEYGSPSAQASVAVHSLPSGLAFDYFGLGILDGYVKGGGSGALWLDEFIATRDVSLIP